jgi:hypothetical protein
VTKISQIKDSYVYAANGDVVYVAYILENDEIIAFGSCGYYKEEGNYYGGKTYRQLWIEGLVSTRKGYGTLVLKALETALAETAITFEVKSKVINVMSVEESVGFHENNGYVDCHTSSRFRGTGNIRLAKPIGNSSLEQQQVIDYDREDLKKYLHEFLAEFIVVGRRRMVEKYVVSGSIPTTVKHNELSGYILNHKDKVFSDSVFGEKVINELVNFLD